MVIITDSREQKCSHILAEFSKQEIQFKVSKLNFGDYAMLGHESNIIIERKANLTELSGNFCQGRRRFEAEFIRASEAGAKIYLLIEDENGKEKLMKRRELDADKTLTAEKRQKGTWRSNFTANAFIASLTSWKEKYNLDIIFCRKQDSAERMLEIFKKYIDAKL